MAGIPFKSNIDLDGVVQVSGGAVVDAVANNTLVTKEAASVLATAAANAAISNAGLVPYEQGTGITITSGASSSTISVTSGTYVQVSDTTATGGSGKGGKIVKLDSNGLIDSTMVPKIAITDTFTAASQAAMVALSDAEKGDICIRTDVNKTYILTSDAASAYSSAVNWKELATPTDAVISVCSKTGAVVLNAGDVGAPALDGGFDSTYFTVSNGVVSLSTAEDEGVLVTNEVLESAILPFDTKTNVASRFTGKFKTAILTGNGSYNKFTINTQWANTLKIGVEVIDTSGQTVYCKVIRSSATGNVAIGFATPPASGAVFYALLTNFSDANTGTEVVAAGSVES